MVPRSADTTRRIHGFFELIGWNPRDHSESEFDTYVSPQVSEGPTPTVAYWQTTNLVKCAKFIEHRRSLPSEYAYGLRLPHVLDLFEVCLIVPSDDDVHNIFDRGGPLLQAHAYIPPHEHAGRQEFRFADPFNYALRVTADPGYEVNLAS
jgi:hypothetical protein